MPFNSDSPRPYKFLWLLSLPQLVGLRGLGIVLHESSSFVFVFWLCSSCCVRLSLRETAQAALQAGQFSETFMFTVRDRRAEVETQTIGICRVFGSHRQKVYEFAGLSKSGSLPKVLSTGLLLYPYPCASTCCSSARIATHRTSW